MTTGILFALMAGLAVALQNMFGARVTEKIGQWGATTLVHFVGFIISGIVLLLTQTTGGFARIGEIPKIYLLGGALGMLIIVGSARSINAAGPALAVSVMVVTQLAMSGMIEWFGWFGAARVPFHFTKPLGLLVMIGGLILYKWKA